MEVPSGYELGEMLGDGGMGTVYAARQPALDRTVAIKLLHPELAKDPAIVARFHTEALAGGRLKHPNIAGVIDFGTMSDGTPFLVMEHVGGERLGTILDREGGLPIARVGALGAQILAALTAAHDAGIVHADVKCDNVLVDVTRGREAVTLIDFGIARLFERGVTDDTAPRMLSGTPEYLAPELISGGPPTIASDLYAVGVVLYELLTGETPFHAGTAAEIFHSHLREDVVAPSLRCPEAAIPPALDRVVMRALVKDPAKRHASAAKFAEELAAAITTAPPRPSTPRTTASSREAPTQDWPTPQRRRPRGTCDHADRMRAAIGDAIVVGDRDAIATGYLDLARALVASRRADLAIRELTQAIDVMTGGDGATTPTPPPSLWRVLVVSASIHRDHGDVTYAHMLALAALNAAARVDAPLGIQRARALLKQLRTAC